MLARGVTWTALVVAACAGCLFYGDLDTFSGATVPNDGGVVPESGKPDATTDAGRFCGAAIHTFCSDFDDGTVTTGWDSPQLEFGGTITPTSTRFVSPGFAAAVRMPRRGASDPISYVTLNKSWPGWRRMVVDFEMYMEAPAFVNGDVNSGAFVISFFSDSKGGDVTFSVGSGYTTMGAGGSLVNGKALAYDRWVHVHLDIDPAKGLKSTVDQEVYDAPFTLTAGTNANSILSLGISGYNRPAPEYKVTYDNVSVDFP